jgi:hypothetical protein
MAELPLTCASPNKRPTVITDAMAQAAADEIATELVAYEPDLGDANEVAADILWVTRFSRQMDGYEIASDLERSRHWSPDFGMAEILDGFGSACFDKLREAEKQWGAENPMEPPHPIGTSVTTRHGAGPIERINEYGVHSYIVLVDGHHLVIPFEDVTPTEPTEASDA